MESIGGKNMSDYEIIGNEENTQLATQMTKFEELLSSYGLPSENVIASIDERENVMNALPRFMSKIQPEQKRDAVYLSKFIAGAAIGLFDASLNFVWDEVVVNLRKKITYFGLDLFFDNAVESRKRPFYQTEDDLSGIKDRTMLDACKRLELISDIVYRKLCHILDMRNQIGASHPNNYNINSYELLGWLQTCVTEVINDKPSPSAITIRSIIENVKKLSTPIDSITLASFESAIKDLSSGMASNLITSLFGLYLDKTTNNQTRNNILELSKITWNYCKSETKYDLGEKVDLYRNNLDEEKVNLSQTFFEKCDGLTYLTLNTRSLKLSCLCEELISAHNGWDNYYNEPQYAREIMKYIKSSSDIPTERTTKLINTFLVCRIGREVTYCHGVSPSAEPLYDAFFKLLSKEQVQILLVLLKTHFVSIYSGTSVRSQNAAQILQLIKSPLLGDRLNEIIDYMLDFNQRKILNNVYKDQGFKELCHGILKF